jgi:hypothetical protein
MLINFIKPLAQRYQSLDIEYNIVELNTRVYN